MMSRCNNAAFSMLAVTLALPLTLTAQPLHQQLSDPQTTEAQNVARNEPDVSEVSLIYVEPPKPREFQPHDLVEIIINESSRFKTEQSLETEKEYDIQAELAQFPSLRHLLELQLEAGDSSSIAEVQAAASREFAGEGTREDTDSFTARVSAEVLEIKPNGNLVIEAKETIESNGEIKTMVLSGVCRGEDVTRENAVLSSKIANMTIRMTTEGEVRKASKKGVLTRVMDALFAF